MDPGRVGELISVVEVATQTGDGPYRARTDRGDGRRRSADGVAWLGLGLGATRLIAIADSLSAACPSDITAGTRPRRTPVAHVTVARRADASLIGALRNQALGELRADWTIESVALLRSHLEADGARYETLHELAL